MTKVEFFFDLSSPWTYMAFHNIRPILAETGAEVTWRPILVGGVFNAVNKAVYAAREESTGPKAQHYAKSLKDWAAWSGLPMNFPSQYHPVRSVHAMRLCCALEDDQAALARFADAAFAAYFGEQRNLDDPAVLEAIADSIGMDGAALLAQSQTESVKLRLRTNTDEVIARGGYGSPSIFVNGDDMYFGNDQLPLVKKAIERAG
ncbi:2-hydroxychromene-2-carboxylate isomerase [Parasphingopyxis lamellibrachiae]|uniref:2-hydroxychromene-2-carboxylate isomerase n=1 Tax=Parasphingopyxis lamellibrachiae TaxID=680125 RepID=A0A3D9FKI5_9SPHN|nr:2-hydroxychromene-2-carboxylate isomerase [Parasphingopyxis lamellibrachiae]RED17626.1 2-hydroxychromene-2-carboxylate isomerase [Parasphingopyxis lamellibrachiae]